MPSSQRNGSAWSYPSFVRRSGATLLGLSSLLATASAGAYSYESVVSDGCHEALVTSALRAVRAMPETEDAARAITPSMEDALFISELPFTLPEDMRDLGGASLLVGVRDNDLKGREAADTGELATVHGDPVGQREHCLRKPGQDGADGTPEAIADCRAYIREAVLHAVQSGLDDHGLPDPHARTLVDVHLALVGTVGASLPIFHVYMGQALHTLQDSYTHTFRTPEPGVAPDTVCPLGPIEQSSRITVALNWIDYVGGTLAERRDGPAHMTALDQCDEDDELRTERKRQALRASTELLRAALDPSLDAARKAVAIDCVLDAHLGYQPGCTMDNRWCDAIEQQYRDRSGCGCRVAGEGGLPMRPHLAIALAAIAIAARRRRRIASAAGAAIALGSAAAAGDEPPFAPRPPASAAPAPPASNSPTSALLDLACVPGRQVACACAGSTTSGAQRCNADGKGFSECTGCPAVEAPGSAQDTAPPRTTAPFGVYFTLGGSLDKTAIATSVAGRYRVADRWLVGVDVEWNPWASFATKHFYRGTLNAYATVVRRWPIGREWVALRTTLHTGMSMLLVSLYGAPIGTVGPYIGGNLIGVEFKLSPRWTLVIEPADIAFPVPHITGAPLSYHQYRFTIGAQFGG